jgi:hypothetical protein
MSALPSSRQRQAKKVSIAARLRSRVFTTLADRPVESAAGAVFAALMTGVLLNALVLQSARHPSPLFGAPANIVLAPSAGPAPEMPKPVPRPAAISAAPAPLAPAPGPAIVARPVAPAHDAETATAKNVDGIGDTLRAAGGSAPSAIDSARVLLVQKALMKLGYVVRPDGVFGSTTRQAIEKFERERGLPARGELTPKVLREISARSGISIE